MSISTCHCHLMRLDLKHNTNPTHKHSPHFVNIDLLQLQQMSTALTSDINQHVRSFNFCFTIQKSVESGFSDQDFYPSFESDCWTVPSSLTDQTIEGALSSISASLTRSPCVQINQLLDSASTQFGSSLFIISLDLSPWLRWSLQLIRGSRFQSMDEE